MTMLKQPDGVRRIRRGDVKTDADGKKTAADAYDIQLKGALIGFTQREGKGWRAFPVSAAEWPDAFANHTAAVVALVEAYVPAAPLEGASDAAQAEEAAVAQAQTTEEQTETDAILADTVAMAAIEEAADTVAMAAIEEAAAEQALSPDVAPVVVQIVDTDDGSGDVDTPVTETLPAPEISEPTEDDPFAPKVGELTTAEVVTPEIEVELEPEGAAVVDLDSDDPFADDPFADEAE